MIAIRPTKGVFVGLSCRVRDDTGAKATNSWDYVLASAILRFCCSQCGSLYLQILTMTTRATPRPY
jgi:hypothetical protein